MIGPFAIYTEKATSCDVQFNTTNDSKSYMDINDLASCILTSNMAKKKTM
jgi:hypothetical protein